MDKALLNRLKHRIYNCSFDDETTEIYIKAAEEEFAASSDIWEPRYHLGFSLVFNERLINSWTFWYKVWRVIEHG